MRSSASDTTKSPESREYKSSKWNPFTPLFIAQNESPEMKLKIKKINDAINNYFLVYTNKDSRNKDKKKALTAIIDVCDEYITSIPVKRRDTFATQGSEDFITFWKNILPEWPHIVDVLELQKKAVALKYLPEDDNNPKARWKLLRRVFRGTKGKHLDTPYWGEYKFRGQVAIAEWLSGENYYAYHHMRSFKEIAAQQYTGSHSHVEYIKDPADYRLTFSRHGHFYQGKHHFDTRGEHPGLRDVPTSHGIFIVSTDGKMYASNSDIQTDGRLHHSSFVRGAPVMCAGTFKVVKGVLQEITVFSGHYKPGKKELLEFLNYLLLNNVDLSNVALISSVGGDKRNALLYLQTQGACLPIDKEKYFMNLAIEQFQKFNFEASQDYLDIAIKMGTDSAFLLKLDLITAFDSILPGHPHLQGKFYPEIKDRNEYTMRNIEDIANNKSSPSQKSAAYKMFILTKDNKWRDLCYKIEDKDVKPYSQHLNELLNVILEDKNALAAFNNVISETRSINQLLSLNQKLYSDTNLSKKLTMPMLEAMQIKALELMAKETLPITFAEEKFLKLLFLEPGNARADFDKLVSSGKIKFLSKELNDKKYQRLTATTQPMNKSEAPPAGSINRFSLLSNQQSAHEPEHKSPDKHKKPK